MSGGSGITGRVAVVLAAAVVASGCMASSDPGATVGDVDCVSEEIELDRERYGDDDPEYTALDGAFGWVQPGAFCQLVAGDLGCGFEVVEYWAGHHGFRIADDPYRDYRSIVAVGFDDGSPGTPFVIDQSGSGIHLGWGRDLESFADMGRGHWERQDMEGFLRNVTKASDETIRGWMEPGGERLWTDPSWDSSRAEPTGIPRGPPPDDLFRVKELYAEVTAGDPDVVVDFDFRDDTERYGPWSFVFHEDSVTVHRKTASTFEEILGSPKDEVYYMRASFEQLDNATLRRAIREAFACLGTTEPDLDGVKLIHMPLPLEEEG